MANGIDKSGDFPSNTGPSADTSTGVIAAYIGLGSNLGNREDNLREACERIEAIGMPVFRKSSIYETEPIGFKDQPWFLNQVIEVGVDRTKVILQASTETPEAAISIRAQAEILLNILLKIETEIGRVRSISNGPRVIDIDLLLFGDLIAGYEESSENEVIGSSLIAPHPRMRFRRFVLAPLCEIAPDLVHPLLKKTCLQLLESLNDDSLVRVYGR